MAAGRLGNVTVVGVVLTAVAGAVATSTIAFVSRENCSDMSWLLPPAHPASRAVTTACSTPPPGETWTPTAGLRNGVAVTVGTLIDVAVAVGVLGIVGVAVGLGVLLGVPVGEGVNVVVGVAVIVGVNVIVGVVVGVGESAFSSKAPMSQPAPAGRR
jgi:hypothetical protein